MTSMASGDVIVTFPVRPGAGSVDRAEGFRQKRSKRAVLGRVVESLRRVCLYAVVAVTMLGLAVYVLSKLVVGSMYIDSCPLQDFIPLYLILSASFSVVFVIIITIIIVCQLNESHNRMSPVHVIASVYFLIHQVLQLAGSVCIIRTRHTVNKLQFDETRYGLPDCDKAFLAYSFGAVMFEMILSGLLFCFAAVSFCEVVCLDCCLPGRHLKLPTAE